MDLSLIILLNSIAVVLVAPVVVATLYLRSQSPDRLARKYLRTPPIRFTKLESQWQHGLRKRIFCFVMYFYAPKWISLDDFLSELNLIEDKTEKYRILRYRLITQTSEAAKSEGAARMLEDKGWLLHAWAVDLRLAVMQHQKSHQLNQHNSCKKSREKLTQNFAMPALIRHTPQ